ncbi:uncharacterized protein [Nicotiana sylvestris]|uniref:uncharacterized protein n=1 Tax=Nicotiana sylvestris TaxID=4096 RepID=UPI00388CA255
MTKEVTPYGVSLWRSIRSLWSELRDSSKIKVYDGNKTSFCKENWHGVGRLDVAFPEVFNLALHQQRTIAKMWTPQGWNIIFRRHINDREAQRVVDFFCVLEQFSGLEEDVDVLRWQGSSKGIFKVNVSYKRMNHCNQQIADWTWKHIWKTKIPYKVACFVWLLAKEDVLTQDNMMKRGLILCSKCFLCRETTEIVNHLFLHCIAIRLPELVPIQVLKLKLPCLPWLRQARDVIVAGITASNNC